MLCDVCGFRAAISWAKGTFELALCGHHSNRHDVALIERGFNPSRINPDLEVFLPFVSAVMEAANA